LIDEGTAVSVFGTSFGIYDTELFSQPVRIPVIYASEIDVK
jgi:hypothetical protein